jgi:23S rRNA pseudouridine2605 synthase
MDRPGPKEAETQKGQRLQKILAQAGLASRRAAEKLILAGRVSVDGKTIREIGF